MCSSDLLDLDPALGMLATSLRFRGDELLAPARARREEVIRVDTLRGMALLAPWANRLPGDHYGAEGRTVDLTALPIERDEQGRPLHGTLTGRGEWVVLEQRADVLVAAVDLYRDPITATAFPFSARIQVEWRLTGDALASTLRDDPEPETVVAVVATAGTTNAGIIDDLEGIGEVARTRDLWFHVDGAYGLAALASPGHRAFFAGIERADSFTVDPHKWLFAPFDCAALVYAEPDLARGPRKPRFV